MRLTCYCSCRGVSACLHMRLFCWTARVREPHGHLRSIRVLAELAHQVFVACDALADLAARPRRVGAPEAHTHRYSIFELFDRHFHAATCATKHHSAVAAVVPALEQPELFAAARANGGLHVGLPTRADADGRWRRKRGRHGWLALLEVEVGRQDGDRQAQHQVKRTADVARDKDGVGGGDNLAEAGGRARKGHLKRNVSISIKARFEPCERLTLHNVRKLANEWHVVVVSR
mmetsp:Transcript_11576/g.29211  ORF Transcript_11576/g.29211 Transcript_11576/m.29211 type:complete len:232 (+) Transcript_11576:869-1564(+)